MERANTPKWLLDVQQERKVQFRHFYLTSEKKRTASQSLLATSTDEQKDLGCLFLIEQGEWDKSDLKQLRWIHRHVNTEGSSSKGWSEQLVQTALGSLTNDGCLASMTEWYDLTVQDFAPIFMDNIMQPIIPYLLDHSLWLLGEPGKAKTPLARSLARLFSRHHGGHAGTACWRTASAFDFFRGIYFTQAIPSIYDDGYISREAVKKMKAQDHLKERWNARRSLSNVSCTSFWTTRTTPMHSRRATMRSLSTRLSSTYFVLRLDIFLMQTSVLSSSAAPVSFSQRMPSLFETFML